MEEHKVEFTFVPPSFGIKKRQLVTLNNISKWWGFAQTKIKQEFKAELNEWYLPKWEENPYTIAEIEYTILRNNGYKIDSDNLAFPYKWLQDHLVENQYMMDDDKIKVVLNPTQLHVEGSVETSVHVTITMKQRYVMTVEELKATIDLMKTDLEKVGGESHTKTASLRVRKMLGEIKSATPQLRTDLRDLDK